MKIYTTNMEGPITRVVFYESLHEHHVCIRTWNTITCGATWCKENTGEGSMKNRWNLRTLKQGLHQ